MSPTLPVDLDDEPKDMDLWDDTDLSSDTGQKKKNILKVKGGDGRTIIIPKGHWYVTPKARPQRVMRISLDADARQVYSCLELATMGFRQELAVKLVDDKKVPLGPSDIVEQTGLSPERVRRALVDLEEAGLVCRRSVDDGPLRKGRIEIYSFAVPRSPQKPISPRAQGGILGESDPELLPLKTFLKRWKITPDAGIAPAREGLKSLSDDIAQWEKAGNALRARAETLCAPSRLNKEERNERNGKENLQSHPTAAAAFPTMPAAAVAPTPAPEPTAPASLPSVPIAAVVAQELSIDDDAARQLIAGCRAVEPSITGTEIVALARQKLFAAREQIRTGKIPSPVGLLIRHVPKMCTGVTLQAVRDQIEAERQERASRIAYAREEWPELNEEERAEVLRKYPELAELAQGTHA